MSNVDQISALLESKFFKYKGKQYAFHSCKVVSYRIMILTDNGTLQIDENDLEMFIKEITPTISDVKKELKSFIPEALPMQKLGLMVPEQSSIFKKLNESFDSLLSEIEGASDEKLKSLEIKSKMLTSVSQSVINMENSRTKLIELINK